MSAASSLVMRNWHKDATHDVSSTERTLERKSSLSGSV